ncbi:MAG: MogA/MoaB family molybdenum cofactor biosynthesis protein [Anaerolineales bacterium]|nr:MogA/MoaB family molybdenum cofactor biosynthesis protein [Anaerolineales bacterium]
MIPIRIGILTISDRSSRGERDDITGPNLAKIVREQKWEIIKVDIIPDEFLAIKDKLMEWSDSEAFDVIITTGGTGFGLRDITPEATKAVIDREAPGLAEKMRAESLKVTLHAMLSRAVVGIRKKTLIINLPGSVRGAAENLKVVIPVIPHAVHLLRDEPDAEMEHHAADINSDS